MAISKELSEFLEKLDAQEFVYYLPQFDKIIVDQGMRTLGTYVFVFGDIEWICLGEL